MGSKKKELEIEEFKNELANYYLNQEIINKLEEENEIVIYEMSGVKGIDYGKIRGNFNFTGIEEKNEKLRKRIEDLEKEIKKRKQKNENIDKILANGNREFLLDLYAKKMTYRKIEKKYKIPLSSIKKKGEEEICFTLRRAKFDVE